MKLTEKELKQIIKEELLQLELFDTGSAGEPAGAMSNAQKKVQCEKPVEEGGSGGTWVEGVGCKELKEELESTLLEQHFDGKTGAPLTDKGRELCAKNPKCKEKHLSGASGDERGHSPQAREKLKQRFEHSKILGRAHLQLKKSLNAVPQNAMLAKEVKEAFDQFEFYFLKFHGEYRAGR